MHFASDRRHVLCAVDVLDLAARMKLTPAEANPYSSAPLPLQQARALHSKGSLEEAGLAYEAAAMVPLCFDYAGHSHWLKLICFISLQSESACTAGGYL